MKITLHQAIAATPYATPTFEGIDKAALIKEIAGVCRKDWESRTWPDEHVPFAPESDQEVLDVYFGVPDEEQLEEYLTGEPDYYLGWRQYEIDLAPPEWEDIDISVDAGLCMVRRLPEAGATIGGSIFSGGGLANETLERFSLSLASAGFPIHLPEFRECLRDTCEALADGMGEFDTDEDVEREISDRDFLMQFDPDEECWSIRTFDYGGNVIPWRETRHLRFETRRECVLWFREFFDSTEED
jgi:hypothetical protein